MKPSDLAIEILNYCQANINEENIKKYSRYFKEGYDAFGLTLPQLELKINEILKNKHAKIDFILETCRILLESPKYEATSFAILLLKSFSKQFSDKTFVELTTWFKIGIRNWAHTDVICGDILSFLLINKVISPESLTKWIDAPNKFQRRAVPVSFIKFVKDTKNVKSLLPLIEPIMMDKERAVQQGIGWFLREAWKINKNETEEFLINWKNKTSRLVFQYATEKMIKEEKIRFKKDK